MHVLSVCEHTRASAGTHGGQKMASAPWKPELHAAWSYLMRCLLPNSGSLKEQLRLLTNELKVGSWSEPSLQPVFHHKS